MGQEGWPRRCDAQRHAPPPLTHPWPAAEAGLGGPVRGKAWLSQDMPPIRGQVHALIPALHTPRGFKIDDLGHGQQEYL